MNTTKIYFAQLNVSKFYTVDSIKKLIDRLSYIGEDVYYNNETRSIDIDIPSEDVSNFDDLMIRDELTVWLKELPAEQEDIDTMINNINYVFNITKIGSINNNKSVVKLYMY